MTLLAVIAAVCLLHVAAAEQPECEVGPSSAYLDGSWEQDASARGGEWYGRPAGHWRRKHSFGFAPCSAGRTYYYWTPRACVIPRLSPESACAALAGQQLLFAGDSTMAEQFRSFVGLLDGTFGRQRQNVISVKAVSASACNNTFVTPLAKDADLVVLSVGQHFEGLVDRYSSTAASRKGTDSRRSDYALSLIARNHLNHTIASSLVALKARGRSSAALVLLGSSVPVPGCSQVQSPLSPAEAVLRRAGRFLEHTFQTSWEQIHLVNAIASAIAKGLGATFVVIGDQSIQRADAWSAHIASAFKRGARLSAEAGAPTGEKRWFSIPLADWLGADGWAPGMEQSLFSGLVSSKSPPCSEVLSRSRRPCNPDALSGRWWWPSVQRR
ncbi:hypothetical protein T492DRAFT_1075467 [Pavlovales sp. CCMP2436]|nr:hypothetical protein T492DRAFT_1075467 [Pavlovales sp. CCMP2436]